MGNCIGATNSKNKNDGDIKTSSREKEFTHMKADKDIKSMSEFNTGKSDFVIHH